MQPNIVIEAINKVLDRYVLLSLLFGCLSLVICSLLFSEWGKIESLGVYAMSPIFVVYFISGAVLYSFIRFWADLHQGKKWLKKLTLEEKKILAVFVKKRMVLPQNEINPQELSDPNSNVPALYYARLEILCDAFVIYKKNIGISTPLIAYIMSKWAWDYLNKNPNLIKS